MIILELSSSYCSVNKSAEELNICLNLIFYLLVTCFFNTAYVYGAVSGGIFSFYIKKKKTYHNVKYLNNHECYTRYTYIHVAYTTQHTPDSLDLYIEQQR